MDARLKEWKLVVDRLWSAAAPDYAQAARLAAEIARSEEPRLAATAAQALPSLRRRRCGTPTGAPRRWRAGASGRCATCCMR